MVSGVPLPSPSALGPLARMGVKGEHWTQGSLPPKAKPTLSPGPRLTLQEAGKGLGARGGDGQRQFVHSHAICHGQGVNFTVGDLTRQQLPEQHPKAAGGEREE